jgi:hypothetical protein
MPSTSDKVLAVLAAEVEARPAWDDPPCLWWIRAGLHGVTLADARHLNRGLAGTGYAADRLLEIAATVNRAMAYHRPAVVAALDMPADCYGIAFRFGAWLVKDSGGARAAARARAAHRRADAAEQTTIWAVDRSGCQYVTGRNRIPGDDTKVPPFACAYPPDGVSASGRVADGLDQLLVAVLRVPLPERRGPASDAHKADR